MQKRPTAELPALYVEAPSFHTKDTPLNAQASPLEIYDVTYLHHHSVLELGLCVSGEGVCYVEDQADDFGPGDVQVIFPFQRHLSKNTGDVPSRWHWLNVDPLALLRASGYGEMAAAERLLTLNMGLCGILSPAKYPEIADLICRLIREAQGDAPLRLPLCGALLHVLVIELSRASEDLPKLKLRRDEGLLRLSPALDLLHETLEQGLRISVEALARACGMSGSSFRRIFEAKVGLPPKAYMINCAIRKAQGLLLTTDWSILDISMAAGFEDVSGFGRSFLAKNGISPSEYRKIHRAGSTENP